MPPLFSAQPDWGMVTVALNRSPSTASSKVPALSSPSGCGRWTAPAEPLGGPGLVPGRSCQSRPAARSRVPGDVLDGQGHLPLPGLAPDRCVSPPWHIWHSCPAGCQ